MRSAAYKDEQLNWEEMREKSSDSQLYSVSVVNMEVMHVQLKSVEGYVLIITLVNNIPKVQPLTVFFLKRKKT